MTFVMNCRYGVVCISDLRIINNAFLQPTIMKLIMNLELVVMMTIKSEMVNQG